MIYQSLIIPSSPTGTLHLLQQDFDEPLLLRTVAWKLVALPRKLVELAVRLKPQYLKVFWIAAMVNKTEEVDEDSLQDLVNVSNVPWLTRTISNCYEWVAHTL